jgi:thioredoxin reductase (NADPH)
VKEFLSSNQIPYQWIDADRDPPTRELIRSSGDSSRLPVVFFSDGSYLAAPTNSELAEKIGMQTRASLPFYDLAIIGAGPAGLAAAVYGASEGLRTVLIEQSAPGGQAGSSSRIENYLGFPSGVSGADLARRATTQARRFGAEVLAHEVSSLKRVDPYRVLHLAGGTEALRYAAVLATGVSLRTLEVPGVQPLLGIGVYYGAAMTEAATYRGQDVCIVGAGNSAAQGALFFSRYARRVTLLARSESLGKSISQYLIDRIAATPSIEVVTGVEVAAVRGNERLEKVVIRKHCQRGEERSSTRRRCSSSSGQSHGPKWSPVWSSQRERLRVDWLICPARTAGLAAGHSIGTRFSSRPAFRASSPSAMCEWAPASASQRQSAKAPAPSAWSTATSRPSEVSKQLR